VKVPVDLEGPEAEIAQLVEGEISPFRVEVVRIKGSRQNKLTEKRANPDIIGMALRSAEYRL
jgi:hypothetical protein